MQKLFRSRLHECSSQPLQNAGPLWQLLKATGFATSVIMCPAEAGIERLATPSETPDNRPGTDIQICNFKYEAL